MRTRGEGTIQKRSDGKFRGKIQIDGKVVFGPTVVRKSDALPALWRKLRDLEEEAANEAAEHPLSTYFHRHITAIKGKQSPTTVDFWNNAVKKVEGTRLGKKLPSSITPKDVDAWADSLGLAPRTTRNYVNAVKQMMALAGFPIKINQPKLRESKQVILTEEECAELLGADMPDTVRPIVQLALLCGLRRSEIAGLRHEDRDGDGIYIKRAVVRSTGAIVVKETKTASSEAWIPLPKPLEWIGSGKGFVIGGEKDPLSPSVLDDRWRRWKKGTKFAKVGLHDLRATFGMNLLTAGVDVRTAAELMRHDPTMLLKVYTRSRRDLKREAMKVAMKVAGE